jgi:hypothetical protein
MPLDISRQQELLTKRMARCVEDTRHLFEAGTPDELALLQDAILGLGLGIHICIVNSDCAQECVLQHLHVHCVFFSARDENCAAVAEVAEHQAFEHVDENRFS